MISGLAIGCRAKRRPLVGKNDEMNQPLVKNLGDWLVEKLVGKNDKKNIW